MGELWCSYLNSLGYSGALQDMLYEALSDRVGPVVDNSLADLFHLFWDAKGVAPGSFNDRMSEYLKNHPDIFGLIGYETTISMLQYVLGLETFFQDP